MMLTKILATVGAAAAATVAFVLPASATVTTGCTSGYLGAYCGAQVAPSGLALDVYQQSATYGNKVIAYTNSPTSTDAGLDLTSLVPPGSYPAQSKEFVFTPNGHDSGFCLSDPSNPGHALVLRPCNGSKFQTWTYDGTGWQNQASGLYMTLGANRTQVIDSTTETPLAFQS